MKKKHYILPSYRVVLVRPCVLQSGSPAEIVVDPTQPGTGTVLSRQDDFDFEDEE